MKVGAHVAKCDFDKAIENIGDRIIGDRDVIKERGWYAFVPKDASIFGHVLVTVENPCIREITTNNSQTVCTLEIMATGIKVISDIIKKIDNVQRVYVALLGESPLHMHYHLLPRYSFIREDEFLYWSNKYRLKKGSVNWQKFYSRPTDGFLHKDGFQYLGEIERTYNEVKKIYGMPSDELMGEMAGMLSKMLE